MCSGPAFDVSILIGRFQPFHLGHQGLLEKALACAPQVVVFLGSAFKPRSARNPFTWEERRQMVLACLGPEDQRRVTFLPVRDLYDGAKWAAGIRQALSDRFAPSTRVVLVGHEKDASTDYLQDFPGMAYVEAGPQGDHNGTALRHQLWMGGDWQGGVPAPVAAWLWAWLKTPAYESLREEYLALEAGRAKWGTGPFVTVDALVMAKEHVLLVRRGQCPGKGLWAIPGGFLEGRERLLRAAKRELLEETGLDLASFGEKAVLEGGSVFDHPDRSQRGRVITHVYAFALEGDDLPRVQGADDAAEAAWWLCASLQEMESELYEDHFHVLAQWKIVKEV